MKSIPQPLANALRRQKYHLVGKHSAVKKCRWLHEALVNNRPCYKQKFYGIKTHQCIQMTPALYYCTQQCLFCWRAQSCDLEIQWKEMQMPNMDPPELIVEESIKAHLRILSGYKGNIKVDKRKIGEALNPRHAAISLTGEPTLYLYISGLIRAFHKRGLTTFLVTNGTIPSILAELDEEPSQLYVSVCAPDEITFKEICRPQIPKAWENLNKTLELLPSFKCPTAIRITSVKGLNMKNVEGYAKLIAKANPTYIEPKAYMHVGFSRLRLRFENMPTREEMRSFAQKIADETGYTVLDEAPESRVLLLSRIKQPIRFEHPSTY